MKPFLVFLTCTTGLLAAAPVRLGDLPPERFRAAGLHKLSVAELAAIEALWAERAAAMPGAAGGDVRAPRPEEPGTVDARGDEKVPGWLKALVTLKRVERQPEDARALESRLAGDFQGWSGRTRFQLENGQVWQQIAGGEYFNRTLPRPAVRIYPAAMGAYWLEVEGVKQRVRVRPEKLE